MGIKIKDLTPDDNITGVEKIPVSDNGAAKSITVDDIMAFVFERLANAEPASSILPSTTMVVEDDGELGLAELGAVIAKVMASIWAQQAEASPTGTDKVAIDKGKTVTLAKIKDYIEGAVKESVRDIRGRTAASEVFGVQVIPVQDGTGDTKKVTVTALTEFILDGFADVLADATEAEQLGDTDLIYILQGASPTAPRRITVGNAKKHFGDVKGPDTTVQGKVPQWDSTSRKLTGGMTVVTALRSADQAEDTAIPTEKAVSSVVAAGLIAAPAAQVAGEVPVWHADAGKLGKGYGVANAISNTPIGNDLPTDKAVADHVESLLTPEVRSELTASNTLVPTERAVRLAINAHVGSGGSGGDGSGSGGDDSGGSSGPLASTVWIPAADVLGFNQSNGQEVPTILATITPPEPYDVDEYYRAIPFVKKVDTGVNTIRVLPVGVSKVERLRAVFILDVREVTDEKYISLEASIGMFDMDNLTFTWSHDTKYKQSVYYIKNESQEDTFQFLVFDVDAEKLEVNSDDLFAVFVGRSSLNDADTFPGTAYFIGMEVTFS